MAPFTMDWLARKDHHGWYQILEEYTSRQLSFPGKDKFHALAGVVQRVQQEWPDDYIAGLFRSDLPAALLWGISPDVEDENICDGAGWYISRPHLELGLVG